MSHVLCSREEAYQLNLEPRGKALIEKHFLDDEGRRRIVFHDSFGGTEEYLQTDEKDRLWVDAYLYDVGEPVIGYKLSKLRIEFLQIWCKHYIPMVVEGGFHLTSVMHRKLARYRERVSWILPSELKRFMKQNRQ